jgi:hypothetical protein
MVYQFKNGHITRHKLNNGHESVRSVAIPIDDSHSFGERIIFAMLLDWLENETHARALVRPTAKMFPNKLGRGETGFFRITTDELCDAVLEAFNKAAEQKSKSPQIEYLGGIRRDTLRS